MDDSDSTLIRLISILALLGLSSFFSACEAAFFSLNPLQISNLKKTKGKSGESVQALLNNPRDLLIAIYIGNEVVNVAISALSTSIAYTRFGNLGISIAIGIGTFVLLLFGEIIPKTLSLKYAESYTLFASWPLTRYAAIVRPIQKLLTSLSNRLLQKLDLEKQNNGSDTMSDDELKTMVDIGENQGNLEEQESQLIQNVIQFGETSAEEIMTPRIEMFTLDINETLDEILPKIIENFYSRVPILDEKGEEVKGFLFTKDLNKFKTSPDNFKLKNHLREPLFIPQSKNIKELLEEFKKKKRHMAVVLDEFGSVCGLVTLEDILEELVGEIDSEMREEELPIVKISPDQQRFRLQGTLTLAEFNKHFQSELPEDKYDTIGGMVFGLFGRIPRSGESVTHDNLKFTIEKMKGARILKLMLLVFAPPNEPEIEKEKVG